MVSGALPLTWRLLFAVNVLPPEGQGWPFRAREQELTFVAFQETVVDPPDTTRAGEAEMVTVGWRTVTVVLLVVEPLGPAQVML